MLVELLEDLDIEEVIQHDNCSYFKILNKHYEILLIEKCRQGDEEKVYDAWIRAEEITKEEYDRLSSEGYVCLGEYLMEQVS